MIIGVCKLYFFFWISGRGKQGLHQPQTIYLLVLYYLWRDFVSDKKGPYQT